MSLNKKINYTNEKEKRKGTATLCSVGAAVLWVILYMIFPLEFYSLFCSSNIGSNVLLVLMSAVVTFPMNFIFSKLLKKDINTIIHLIINVIGMLAAVYTYSIFRYDAVYWIVLAATAHSAAAAVLFVKSKSLYEQKGIALPPKRLSSALYGIVCTLASDFIYLLLFIIILESFR